MNQSTTRGFVGLDFETYAATDLLKHGLDRYVSCPDFRPLVAVVTGPHRGQHQVFDFVEDYKLMRLRLTAALQDVMVVAHNAGFEQAVLRRMNIDIPSEQFIDSAVLARAAGAAGKLEAAGPQLLGMDKLESGFHLIKLFSIPGNYQINNGHNAFDPAIIDDHKQEWQEFIHYCMVDADISYELAAALLPLVSEAELKYNTITMDMNNIGWPVDLNLVHEMQRRYVDNVDLAIDSFRIQCDAPDLNLSSFPQLKAWCEERGVKASSFDEAAVEKMLKSLAKKLTDPRLADDKRAAYEDVAALLHTKQVMGGSSLKKLQTIIDTVGEDGRLHDQYLHIGAGATFRTTGRGVQMQNLKRLNGEGDDVELLFDEDIQWDNSRLASNLRQVFRSSHPKGRLIVGDFSSVESRGLAWQAGEQWKLDAYAQGQDLYKVQAAKIFGIPLDKVGKTERQIGKVGELACGYGAGPDAVRNFAAKMGVVLTPLEAANLVRDWRAANEGIVQYWKDLDTLLYEAVVNRVRASVLIPNGTVQVNPVSAPLSLKDQTGDPGLVSLRIRMYQNDGRELLSRVIHGANARGRNIHYWKPSERKTGDLWSDQFTDPKTKQVRPYTVYGGKLSGLLTQSLCREVFFTSLADVHEWVQTQFNVELIGQFHDEIVLDWTPSAVGPSLNTTKKVLEMAMTNTVLKGFPLSAEIKDDYRYTK